MKNDELELKLALISKLMIKTVIFKRIYEKTEKFRVLMLVDKNEIYICGHFINHLDYFFLLKLISNIVIVIKFIDLL